MNIERLVRMANDIGNFFKAEPDHGVAVNSVATHLKRFWDPRMRKEIVAHLDAGGIGLDREARHAIEELRKA